MANIEIHGFGDKTKNVKDAIWAGFLHNEELRDFARNEEVVVTTFASFTGDIHGRSAPFVRVFFATKKEKETCLAVLKRVPNLYQVCFDVEFVQVEDFCRVPPKIRG